MASHLTLKFQEFVSHKLLEGQDGHGRAAQYVPLGCLEEYWTDYHVRELLDSSDPPIAENARQVRTSYLRVFSILTYIGQTRDIVLFVARSRDDHQLPLDDRSYEWLPSLSLFLETQWMFCPLEFPRDVVWKRQLSAQQILPATFVDGPLREERRGQGAARIRKVRLHDACHALSAEVRSSSASQLLAVMKSY